MSETWGTDDQPQPARIAENVVTRDLAIATVILVGPVRSAVDTALAVNPDHFLKISAAIGPAAMRGISSGTFLAGSREGTSAAAGYPGRRGNLATAA
jgi:hypothetical protein